MAKSVTVTPLTPIIGAEVSGVDLASIDDDGFSALKEAFLEHSVLFFRDQDISIDAHKAFGRRFGDLHIHPAANDYNDGVKDLSLIHI